MSQNPSSRVHFSVCVRSVEPGADKSAITEKLSKFCRGATKEELEVAVSNPPFSFRRTSFEAAQAAKVALEGLGCSVYIREGEGVSLAEETVLLDEARRAYRLRLARGVDEERIAKRISFFTTDHTAAEAYRTLRTNLLVTMQEEQVNGFLFTSALPGEGKSTTIVNLGVALASAGKKTILVDMDLRRPALDKVLGIDNSLGVSNVILDGLDARRAISSTLAERLHLLPSGPMPPNPAELLSSSVAKELMGFLTDEFDVVLVDSPPVIGLTDAAVIGAVVGNALLVVLAGQTPREQATLAVRMLEDVRCRVLGVVLNQIDLRKPYYRYYFYQRHEYPAQRSE